MIQVTLLDTVELATYTVRTFALYKVWHRLGCSWGCSMAPGRGSCLFLGCIWPLLGFGQDT